MDIPYVELDTASLLYEFSEALIKDDKHDIGYFTYRNRKSHKYHGKPAPNHPSPIHHWQIGGLGIALSLVMGLLHDLQEMQKVMQQENSVIK